VKSCNQSCVVKEAVAMATAERDEALPERTAVAVLRTTRKLAQSSHFRDSSGELEMPVHISRCVKSSVHA